MKWESVESIIIASQYSDVAMSARAFQISISTVSSVVCSGAYQIKLQRSVLLAFVTTGGFPPQMASGAEKNSIQSRHHART